MVARIPTVRSGWRVLQHLCQSTRTVEEGGGGVTVDKEFSERFVKNWSTRG